MPSAQVLQPKGGSHGSSEPVSIRPMVGTLFMGVGVALLLGTVLDFGLLWIVQHQDNAQWEFAALATTMDQYSLILVGISAIAAAMHLKDSTSLGARRTLITICLVAAGVVLLAGILILTDFFEVQRLVAQDARRAFFGTVAKSVVLSVVYTIVLVSAALRGRWR